MSCFSRAVSAGLLCLTTTIVGATEFEQVVARVPVWESAALMCTSNGVSFPTKQRFDPKDRCEDGDMTLFNGLLCAAGEERGCVGVAEAQDPESGLWHRSPRIRFLGKNDRGPADSSPDMAIGIQLYLVAKKDVARARKWLAWIGSPENFVCVRLFGICIDKQPSFCSNENCVIRPQDYAALANAVNFLQEKAGMEALPDGKLRGNLGTASGYEIYANWFAASFNDPGFSQHTAGAALLQFRLAGENSNVLAAGLNQLRARNPGNAFFSYLAKSDREKVSSETLARCTGDLATLGTPRDQWQWETSGAKLPDGLYPWQRAAMWDCLLVAKLLGAY